MLSRSIFILAICAIFGVTAPVFHASAASTDAKTTTLFKKKSDASKDDDDKDDADKAKSEAQKKADKEKARSVAAEKAREAKKQAMRDKAKADAEKARVASESRKGSSWTLWGGPKDAKDGDKPANAAKAAGNDNNSSSVYRAPNRLTADRIAAQEAAAVGADTVLAKGNRGELRSGDSTITSSTGFLPGIFGRKPVVTSVGLLPETRALDSALEKKKKFKVRPEYEPQSVSFSGYPRGSIVIDTDKHFLYYVESSTSARRYGIAVGRDGLQFKGTVFVGDKQEWPRWIPTKEMQDREPKKYGRFKDGMPGGGQNPLGARAIYLYQGQKDTHLRIHGTVAPQSIGTNASNGCFRMINDHVIELYGRVRVGTPVYVL